MKNTITVLIIVFMILNSVIVFAQEGEEEEVKAKVEGDVMEFEEMLIKGRIDRPILLTTARANPEFKKITFERSFMEDILRPIDKEEFEKRVRTTKFDAVRRPLVWISSTTAIVSGSVAGYMYYNEEKGSGLIFAVTAGISAGTALILWLVTD
jgi:hypothetical protein